MHPECFCCQSPIVMAFKWQLWVPAACRAGSQSGTAREVIKKSLLIQKSGLPLSTLEEALPQSRQFTVWVSPHLVYLLPSYAKHMPGEEKAFPSAETRTGEVPAMPHSPPGQCTRGWVLGTPADRLYSTVCSQSHSAPRGGEAQSQRACSHCSLRSAVSP